MSGPQLATHRSPRVGYILKMFPRLSETFILNELLELEAQGVEVSVFSTMYPVDGRFHGRLAQLKLGVETIPRDKPEAYWERLHGELAEHTPPFERWNAAYAFLRRHAIPKDLDLLLRAAIIAARVDALGIQHLHSHFATVAARLAALVHLMTGVPFSFTSHAKDIFRETVDREIYRELVDRSAFNITVSDFNREFILAETPGVDAEKVVRLYNGIDLEYFRPVPGIGRESNRIVSIGRLVPKKGFDHLLRAARRLLDRGRTFRLSIVGDGESRDELLALHRTLGLGDSVEFLGARSQDDVRELLARSSFSVLACVPDEIGNRDALPTTLLESLACGVPAISTRLTGVPEIIDDTVGAIVEPGDDEALARAIERFLDNVPGDLSRACRARAEERFDLRRNVATLREHFERSVGASSS